MLKSNLKVISRDLSGPENLDYYETASRDELAAWQHKRLAWSLRHAYENVPHYRKRFDEKGVHPGDFKTLQDLSLFPFITKTDLRENYPFGLFAVPPKEVSRIHASSGTTGKPTVVGYTQNDIDMWAGLMTRSLRAAGCRPGMKVHIAYNYGLMTGGLGSHYGAERLGCTVIPMSSGSMAQQVQIIQDFEPDVIMVTPSQMLAILDEYQKQGLDPRRSSLRIGIFGAEPWTNAMRRELEEAFDFEAIDIYGLSEVIGPGVANECAETKDSPHIWEDHFYPEIIDPETGEVLPDGSVGELVFTSLTKEAMPVIRYRTRDLTRLLPGSARPMRRMEKLRARMDDVITLDGIGVYPSQIEEKLLEVPELSPHYQVVLTHEGNGNRLEVQVELRRGACAGASGRRHLQDVLSRHVKSTLGVTVKATVLDPGSLDRSQGKAKRIVRI